MIYIYIYIYINHIMHIIYNDYYMYHIFNDGAKFERWWWTKRNYYKDINHQS